MTNYEAVSIAEGFGEGKNATEEQWIEAYQYLIDIGLCWELQGFFGQTAKSLIEAGMCHN